MPRHWKKLVADALLATLAVTIVLWTVDWAIWRIRVSHGGGYDSVQVTEVMLTPLKNKRLEADAQSTANQPCTRSIFPHAGDDPCWWLRRHTTDYQRI